MVVETAAVETRFMSPLALWSCSFSGSWTMKYAVSAAPAAAIDLDDVFADCFFGREGDADLLDDIAAAAPAAAPPPPPPQKKRSRAAPAASDMTEAQRDERRER